MIGVHLGERHFALEFGPCHGAFPLVRLVVRHPRVGRLVATANYGVSFEDWTVFVHCGSTVRFFGRKGW